MTKILLKLIIIFLTLFACTGNADDSENKGRKIARVYDTFLYENEIKSLHSNSKSKDDSIALVEKYIKSWIREQLLLKEAQEKQVDFTEIDQRAKDYRDQLLLYAYQKKLIEQNLDSTISDSELETYYTQFKENFKLNENIIKGKIAKISVNDDKLSQLENWFNSNKEEDLQKLRSHCLINSYQFLADSSWKNPRQFVKEIKISDLRNRKFYKYSDKDFVYLFQISELKEANEYAPIDYVKQMISDIIVSKRKVELQQKQEEQIFERASRKKDYEVFIQ
ncbi:MAG: hypothetical protein EAZ97_05855 [Bacteroidetes bacterium]|nr:MAG: hypothetical protein EAZ97_05855 [Bacteroidota bacterium]